MTERTASRAHNDLAVRQVTPSELPSAIQLLRDTFVLRPDASASERVLDAASDGEAYGAFDATGRLIAYVQWMPVEVHLQGHTVCCGLMGPGATAPGSMGRGVQTRLMRTAAEAMRRSGCALSLIETPVYGWHQRNGWEVSTSARRYSIELDRLRRLAAPSTGALGLDAAAASCANVYGRAAPRCNMSILRDERWWRTRVLCTPSRRAVAWMDDEGLASGYVVYEPVEHDTWTIHVWEMFTTRSDAYRGLLRYLADHSLARTLTWDAPIDDVLVPALVDPAASTVSWQPDKTARVLNVRMAMAAALRGAPDGLVTLLVEDAILPANSGWWRVEVEDGLPAVDRTPPASGSAPVVRCDVGVLAPLLTGACTVAGLLACGRLGTSTVEGLAALDQLLERRLPPYLPEAFY